MTLKRFRIYRSSLRIILITICFAVVISYIPVCAWLWKIPAERECEGTAQSEFVKGLTPYDFAAHRSYPYELLYIPEKRLLCATFKMAGNLVLNFWSDPASNRLVVIDMSKPDEPRLEILPMEGGLIPEYMAYNVKTKELLVTRIGFKHRRIDFVSLERFPEMELVRSMEIGFEPHSLALYPDKSLFAVLKIPQELVVYDYSTLKEQYQTSLKFTHAYLKSRALKEQPLIFLSTMLVANIWQHRILPIMYVDMVGKRIVEVNLKTKELRFADVPWAGGNIAGVPETDTIYSTDVFFGGLNVVDMSGMKLKRRMKLGYKSRAIQGDFGRDLLIIGDWFRGRVNLYRLSTLERLDYLIPVGPYLRDFAYDSERGLLFAGSKCGVYQVDIDKIYRQLTFKD